MKTAVSIPDELFEAADRLAKRRRMSRSALYAEALAQLLVHDDDVGVTARLDHVYDEHESSLERSLADAQSRAVWEEW